MQRLRLLDYRLSRGPRLIGACQQDIGRCAEVANSAERRLVLAKEAGEEGWFGTWAEIAFNVSRSAPYLTTPREVARVEALNVCERPVMVQNQFAEYLQYGNGRLPKTFMSQLCNNRIRQAFTRNSVPTFTDLSNPPQFIRIFTTDPADIGAQRRILLQGTDNSGNTIYSQDGLVQVTGQWVTFASPYAVAPMQFNSITGIQKDITNGQIQVFQVDPNTGTQTLLLTMEPGETTASYRRYYLDNLPRNCCAGTGTADTVTITAIAKLDMIPVVVDTDYFIIQNLEALIEECQAVRYSEMDSAQAAQLEAKCHARAIGHLNGELAHYLGKNRPAVSWKPFGSACLERVAIGMT